MSGQECMLAQYTHIHRHNLHTCACTHIHTCTHTHFPCICNMHCNLIPRLSMHVLRQQKNRSLGIKLDLSYAHYTLLLHPHTLTHPHMHTPHTCTPISSSSGAGLNATRGEIKRKRYQSHTSVSRCIEAAKTISSKARLHTKRCSHLIGKRRQQTFQQPNRHRGTVGTHIKKFFFSKHFYAGGIEIASFPGSGLVPGKWPRSREVASFPGSGLVPRKWPCSREVALFPGSGLVPWKRPRSQEVASFPGSGLVPGKWPRSREAASFPGSGLIPRKWPRSQEAASFPGSSLVPVFDCSQYAKIYCKQSKTGTREGLATRLGTRAQSK